MPSLSHEALLVLFRNRPQLAAELLRDALSARLPEYSDVKVGSADLTEVQPAEYRADLVLLLSSAVPVLGLIVEVQLSIDDRKRFTWPMYVASLRATSLSGLVTRRLSKQGGGQMGRKAHPHGLHEHVRAASPAAM